MRGIATLAVVSSLILSGCAAKIAGSGSPPGALSRPSVYYATEASFGPCLEEGEAAILATLAGAVIGEGVNRIGKAISAAGEAETKVITSRRNIEVAKGARLGPCVHLARGWFYRPDGDGNAIIGSNFVKSGGPEAYFNTGEGAKKLRRSGLYLASTPDFFFEGRMAASSDAKSYTILPSRVYFGKPISSHPLRQSGKRNILVSFALSPVGKTKDLNKGGGSTMVLGQMKPGDYREFDPRRCFSRTNAGAGEFPYIPDDCGDGNPAASIVIRSPFESEWFSVALKEPVNPMNLQSLVSETRDASEFLSFVGAVFNETKGDLTKELQQALIPSVGAEADATAFAAEVKSANAADKAFGEAYKALNECISAPSDGQKRATARSSVRSYIQAARAAEKDDISVTVADADSITLNGTSAGECQSALTKLTS